MCGVSKKPSVRKLWREKGNMQMSWSSPSATFAQFRDQRNAAATLRVTGGSNVASEASYWCNRRETSEIQAKAYSGQRGTRTRMRSIYVHNASVYVHVHVCARPAYEFRRGFCTSVLFIVLLCYTLYWVVNESRGVRGAFTIPQ